MDPRTSFIIATLMMLFNGGVLGLMHRGLSADVQPSATDWRIGTLLAAGGSILLAVQEYFPPGFILTVGNGCLFMAMALYWRSARRFSGRADTPWVFAPVVAGAAGIFWFAGVTPDIRLRVMIATATWLVPLTGAAATLLRSPSSRALASCRVLAFILLADAAFMLVRAMLFASHVNETTSILNAGNWLNAITPLIVTVLPVIGTTAFLTMCSERIRGQWELAASTDYLTGLPNRRTIHATGEARFNAARRAGQRFAVAIVDIDHFKSINDRFGHEAGDHALKRVAAVLEANCRGPYMVGRQGGEEFVVLLEDASFADAAAAADRLREAVERMDVELNGATHRMTVSIGLGTMSAADEGYEDVLRRADRALYAAKAAGRNRVESGDVRTMDEEGDSLRGGAVAIA
jgi:diguanylate cyclase (GGDEF)-like protein